MRDCGKRGVFTCNKVNAFLKPGYLTKQIWAKTGII